VPSDWEDWEGWDDEPYEFDAWHNAGWNPDYPTVPDPEIVGQLAAAWSTWHGHTRPTGLLNQLQWIRFNTPEGRAGRPADAVGVPPQTWNAWMSRALGLRDAQGRLLGAAPNAASRARIGQVLARGRAESGRLPTRAYICACVVWAGYQNGRGQVIVPDLEEERCTTLDDLYLAASSRAWALGQDWEAAAAFIQAVSERYDGEQIDFFNCNHLELKP
jgi:hypothetical protein